MTRWVLLFVFIVPLRIGAGQPASPLLSRASDEACGNRPDVAEIFRCVDVNLSALEASLTTGKRVPELQLALLGDLAISVRKESILYRGPNSFTYYGRVVGGGSGYVTLVAMDGALEGIITLDSGEFRLRGRNGGPHQLYKVNFSELPYLTNDALLPPGVVATSAETMPVDRNSAAATMDVLIVYTSDARVQIEQAGSIAAHLQALIDWTNLAYANGAHPEIRLNLVGMEEISYAASSDWDMSTDLGRVAAPGDGWMDEVHVWREQYGADLVNLVTNVTNGACGIAFVGSPDADGDHAFSVTARQCGATTFAHELGHNQGMMHDTYVSNGTQPFEYGHGYVDVVNEFMTIMAYPDECVDAGVRCFRIQHFSDPDIFYLGAPVGTPAQPGRPTSDNMRVLEQMAPIVEDWKESVPIGTHFISGRVVSEFGDSLAGVRVNLSGSYERATVTNENGVYAFAGLKDGVYTVTPTSEFFSFSPASREVLVRGANVLEQDFTATLTNSAMVLDTYSIWLDHPGNGDRVANPGEVLDVEMCFTNQSGEIIPAPYVVPVRDEAEFLNTSYPGLFGTAVRAFRDFESGESGCFGQSLRFLIDGRAPAGEFLTIPLQIYREGGVLIGSSILEIPLVGTDRTAPDVGVEALRATQRVGESVTIEAFVLEGGDIDLIKATIEGPDEAPLTTLSLFDNGTHGDVQSGDRTFTTQYIPQEERLHFIDVVASDNNGNIGEYDNIMRFTTRPFFKTRPVLLVTVNPDISGGRLYPHSSILTAAGWEHDSWKTYLRGAPPPEVVHQYGTLVWDGFEYLGFNQDELRATIGQFLDRHGALFMDGSSTASILESYAPEWLGKYLHVASVNPVRVPSVTGIPDELISDGIELDLNTLWATDEIDPGPGAHAILRYDETAPSGTLKPRSSGTAAIRVDDGTHKLVFLGFSLAQVVNEEERTQFVRKAMEWLTNSDSDSASYTLTVLSRNPDDGIAINVAQSENDADQTVTTPASLEFAEPTIVTLTAPTTALNGNPFAGWQLDEGPIERDQALHVDIAGDRRASALFLVPPDHVTATTQTDATGSDSIVLSWDRVDGAALYHIQIGDSKQFDSLAAKSQAIIYQAITENTSYTFPDDIRESGPNYWRIRSGTSGLGPWSLWSDAGVVPTNIDDHFDIPNEFALRPNYPNPFNPTTTITYALPNAEHVKLAVYDLLGREIEILVNDERSPGTYKVVYIAKGIPSGVYFYRLEAGPNTATRMLTIAK